ncbi:hypothetical protein GIB67_001660 [Kingdonia uniflora]|uniref:Uncharacterized protein n=1 Tax=Kingdonia uniflora TaxID=39325 RepID=A0A7J7L0W0_9MAGN|nr:hypothetical protein GIB67_001660 [Kingdonia uniflora]
MCLSSCCRQQDPLKNIVEIRPKRHRVSSPSDRSSSRAPVNPETKPGPEKERSPALPGQEEVESKPESPVKSLLGLAYESSDEE